MKLSRCYKGVTLRTAGCTLIVDLVCYSSCYVNKQSMMMFGIYLLFLKVEIILLSVWMFLGEKCNMNEKYMVLLFL